MINKKDLYFCYCLRIKEKLEAANIKFLVNGLSKPSKTAMDYGLAYGTKREFWVYERTEEVEGVLEQDKKEKDQFIKDKFK